MNVLKYELQNLRRNRWILLYMIAQALAGFIFLRLSGDPKKALLSLSTLGVGLIPLVTTLLTVVSGYYNEKYTELLLTQPVSRKEVFFSRILSLVVSLSMAWIIGAMSPFAFYGYFNLNLAIVLMSGVFLTMIFTSLGLWIVNSIQDRIRGIGIALVLWLYFVFMHDAIVLGILLVFREYPLDFIGGFLTAINPVGLIRVLLLRSQEGAVLLGEAGTRLGFWLTSIQGAVLGGAIASFWLFVPTFLGWRRFRRRDF